LADLIKTVKAAPEGRGIGVIYWHPEATFIPGATGRWSRPDANSLFDIEGYPLSAMNVLVFQPASHLARSQMDNLQKPAITLP
jgi:arabinogalactan endo-1,4-beta-galactosidase